VSLRVQPPIEQIAESAWRRSRVTTLIDFGYEEGESALSLSLCPVHRAQRIALMARLIGAADVNAETPRLRPSLLQMSSQSNSFARWIAKWTSTSKSISRVARIYDT
jgi:hypothetical protein